MADGRYPRNSDPQSDYYGRSETQDYGRDYGSGRDYGASSARSYEAAGAYDDDRGGWGQREYGNQRYGQREQMNRGRGSTGDDRSYGGSEGRYGSYREGGSRDYGRSGGYGRDDRYGQAGSGRGDYSQGGYGSREPYRGSYSSDGRRFEDVGRYRNEGNDEYRDRPRSGGGGGDYGRQPQGYDYDDRGFVARAGDEVRSWFGDEDAERRRELDARYDDRGQARHDRDRDSDYGSWRSQQIAGLDRDYDEYRHENRQKFHSEFSSWRTQRQGQRDQLTKVSEHMDVVGSDDEHVGTVDKVKGDRILLTKNDADAGGRHHSIPSSWVDSVDDKVKLRKSAADAKAAWQDEESNAAKSRYGDNVGGARGGAGEGGLNRSFSGTY